MPARALITSACGCKRLPVAATTNACAIVRSYHGDPFGPQCLYSCANYSSTAAHPPLIGYGLDGYPIFGRHLSASAPGASVALDDCGGHVHSGMGDPYIVDNSYQCVTSCHCLLPPSP